MKTVVVGVTLAVGLGAAAIAGAQDRPAGRGSEQQAEGRYRLFVMEGVLERAVQNGAAVLSRQIRSVSPDALFLSGAVRARGFRLEGYGVFFDVDVPALRPTVAWTLRTMMDDNGASLAQLKAYVQKVQDPRERADLQRAIRRLELLMPSPRGSSPLDAGAGPQTVADRTAAQPVPGQLPVDDALLADPAGAYTREVKAALADAMVENSGPLALGPDEWLTIAARDSEPANRLVPGDAYDLTTWIMRVKGSDLAAYRAGRLTRAEIRAKVEIRER